MGQHVSLKRHAARTVALVAILAMPVASTPASAAFDGPTDVSQTEPEAFTPQIAMEPDGDALIVWQGNDGTKRRIRARRRSAAGGFGGIQTVSAAGQDADSPQVAVGADGDALIVWRRFDGLHSRVQARTRSAAGTLGPVRTLSAAERQASHARVAMDADGDGLVVWQIVNGGAPFANWHVQASTVSAAGQFARAKNLSPTGQKVDKPQVALDASGGAVVAWYRLDTPRYQIEARTRSPAGALGPIQILSASDLYSTDPKVAVDPDGNALVVWSASFMGESKIQAAAGP